MNFNKIYSELKRRNVFKVATAYAIVGWLIIQICATTFPFLNLPDWFITAVIVFVLIGFPLAIIFAWAFELTADGLKKTDEVDKTESVTPKTGKKLNYWIIGALTATIVFMGVERIWFAGSHSDTPPVSDLSYKASVAVLPFVDLSPESDQEWFSDGLTDDILNNLTRIKNLKVIARTSSFAFKGKNIPIQIIADSLGVEYILEGSVRRLTDNNDLRVTAQLIRADDAAHIWSHNYNRSIEDLFQIQDQISESIAGALGIYLDPEDRNMLAASGTQNIEAYEAFLKGKEIYYEVHQASRNASIWEANKYFEKAIDLDPQFSQAYFYHHDLWAHRLFTPEFEELKVSPEGDSISLRYAQQQIQSDLNNAFDTSKNDYQRLYIRATQIFFSNNWTGLSSVIDRLFEESHQLTPSTIMAGSFLQDAFLVFNKLNDFKNLLHKMHELDPIFTLSRFHYQRQIAVAQRDIKAIDSLVALTQQVTNNYNVGQGAKLFIEALTNPQNLTEADQPIETKMVGHFTLGNQEASDSLFTIFKKMPGIKMDAMPKAAQLWYYYFFQQDDEVSRVAAEIDSQPLGVYQLIVAMSTNAGRLLFDLNDTPVLKQRLEEAGIDVEKMNEEQQFRSLLRGAHSN